MSFASVAVSAVGVGASIYKGLKSKSQDNAAAKEGASVKRSFYQIPQEYIENRNIAAGQAQGGLTADEKSYMGEQRERGLASSLEALGESGGGPNEFSKVNKVFDDSLKSQAVLDSQQHLQNINFFTNANKELAGQKATQFGINELQPYESKLKEIQDRRIAAQTNEGNAVSEGIESLSALATGLNSRNPRFGNSNPGGSSPSPYSRRFGLEKTGGVAGSPAGNINRIDPNGSPDITKEMTNLDDYWKADIPIPKFTPDEWHQMKQDAIDEGSNVTIWNQ